MHFAGYDSKTGALFIGAATTAFQRQYINPDCDTVDHRNGLRDLAVRALMSSILAAGCATTLLRLVAIVHKE